MPALATPCVAHLPLKEIDDLVDEWTPEPLAAALTPREQSELDTAPVIVGPTGPKPKLSTGKTVINLASYNFTGLAGNEVIKERAIETLRKYGLGSCGPPGFYGTQGSCFHGPFRHNWFVMPSSRCAHPT